MNLVRGEIARQFDKLKRELVALVANDYGKATLITAANKVIDVFYEDLADWAETEQVDLAEYDLERLEKVYSDENEQ
jgi:hypothetical protein